MTTTPTLFPFSPSFTQTTASPLTTRFTPPASCTAPTAYAVSLAWKSTHPECWPYEGFSLYQHDSRSWYSPGVCPLSYNYVATSVQSPLGGAAADQITMAVCCPPGFGSWNSDNAWYCTHAMRASDRNNAFWQPLFTATASEPIYPTSLLAMTFGAFPVSVAWKESDLAKFTPALAPVKDLIGAGVPLSLLQTPSPQPTRATKTMPHSRLDPSSSAPTGDQHGGLATHTNTPQPNSTGLSTGAAVGVAVAGTITFIAFLAAMWFMLRRCRRSRASEHRGRGGRYSPSDNAGASHKYGAVSRTEKEPGVAELPYTYRPYEVGSDQRLELDGRSIPVEVDGGRSYWEY